MKTTIQECFSNKDNYNEGVTSNTFKNFHFNWMKFLKIPPKSHFNLFSACSVFFINFASNKINSLEFISIT